MPKKHSNGLINQSLVKEVPFHIEKKISWQLLYLFTLISNLWSKYQFILLFKVESKICRTCEQDYQLHLDHEVLISNHDVSTQWLKWGQLSQEHLQSLFEFHYEMELNFLDKLIGATSDSLPSSWIKKCNTLSLSPPPPPSIMLNHFFNPL